MYAALLVLTPRRFRAEYGDEMVRLYGARVGRARAVGRLAAARVATAGLVDLAVQALAARLDHRRPPGADTMFAQFTSDLRVAARTLRRQPGFTLTVLVVLWIGLGATTVVMGLVEGAVLRPLPYPQPHRLVSIVQTDPRFGQVPFAPPYLRDLRERTTTFEAVAGFSPTWDAVLVGDGERQVRTAYVSDGALELLGVAPVWGRLLQPDDHASRQQVALVSDAFWRTEFGAGTPLASQRIRLNEAHYTIVGILPAGLRMPITGSVVNPTSDSAEIWLPFSLNPYYEVRQVPVMNVIARLQPGVDAAQASAALAPVTATLVRDYPEMSREATILAVSLGELVSGSVRTPLLLLLVAVVCLLLIGCANVVNLSLARASERRNEFAVRASLGATGWRVTSLLLAESVLLAVGGAAGGIVLAIWGLSALPALVVADLPPSASLQLDARVIAAAGGVGLVCALVLGLVPAMWLARPSTAQAAGAGLRTTGDRAARRTRRVLIGLEVALAMILLAGAGLMAKSYWQLTTVDPGFEGRQVFATSVGLPGIRYPTAGHRRAFVGQALERLSALPGVSSASAVNRLPLGGSNVFVGVEIEGAPPVEGGNLMDRRVVVPGYFDTLGIAILEGRAFGSEDRVDSPAPVAIINETAARQFPPGTVIDRRLRLMLRGGPGPWLRIVGVVGDIRHHGLSQATEPEIYVPYEQAAVESLVFVMRSATPPATLAGAVRDVLKGIDPDLYILPTNQTSLGALEDEALARPRLRTGFVVGFALVALTLAAVGIYGVVSYAVARERRNIGVRLALGAEPGRVTRGVLWDGLWPVGAGVVVGAGGALLGARSLASFLFEVGPADAATFVTVAVVLLAAAVLAAYLPARRASRIDPLTILRPE